MMNFAFAAPAVIAVGLSSVLAGCGGGGGTTTTTTTTMLFDSHVKWVSALMIEDSAANLEVSGIGPSIGADGTVFMPAVSDFMKPDANYLFALDGDDGVPKWQFALVQSPRNVPVVGLDGSVYLLTGDAISQISSAQAVNGDGTEKWIQDFNLSKTGRPPALGLGDAIRLSSMALSSDGSIFVGIGSDSDPWAGSGLSALDGNDGAVKWHIPLGALKGPVVAPDNTIFVTGYVEGASFNLFALQGADGSVKWNVSAPNPANSLALGAHGTVLVCYPFGGGLVAYDGGDGLVKWRQPAACSDHAALDPVVGSDGTIFVHSADPLSGNEGHSLLLAVNGDDGAVKWSFNASKTGPFPCTTAAVSVDGTVYIGFSQSVYALDAQSGAVRWNSTTHGNGLNSYSAPPVIGPDGTVFIVASSLNLDTESSGSRLVALHGEGGPATAPYGSGHAQGGLVV